MRIEVDWAKMTCKDCAEIYASSILGLISTSARALILPGKEEGESVVVTDFSNAGVHVSINCRESTQNSRGTNKMGLLCGALKHLLK